MKIQTSSLNLQSAHFYNERYERKESLSVEEKPANSPKSDSQDKVDFKENQARKMREGWRKNGYPAGFEKVDLRNENKKIDGSDETGTSNDDDNLSISDIKTRIMKMVLEQITGEKIHVYNGDESDKSDSSDEQDVPVENGEQQAPVREITTKYQLNESYFEQESLTFEAVGEVTTEDGKSLSFALSLSQQREFFQETSVAISSTEKLVDPLVVNFDGRGAQLTDEKVDFDLNSDGTAEKISNLQSGSAFLARDANGDGEINNGSELFGPSTGSGFGELSQFDNDKNGWIDENDPVFYELRLWKPGHESSTLLERGVGAISLSSVGGSFQLKNSEQQILGAVKNQGIYLNEKTGSAGMVQELDLSA